MAGNPPGQSSGGASTRWQETLDATCRERNMPAPHWQMFSDRRGGRTAWTCQVTAGGETFSARNWYDGSYVNNAKEDAAELALRRMGVQDQSGAQGSPQAVAGQQQPPGQGDWYRQ